MEVSNALLRSISNRGWNKPLITHSMISHMATEKARCHSTTKVCKEAKASVRAVLCQSAPKRLTAEAPKHTKQFVKSSTTALRDQRLSSTAKCLLMMIKALAGKSDQIDLITKGQLASVIGRSRRTVQYALGELKSLGYLTLETVKGYFGLYAGLRISLGDMTKAFSAKAFYQKAAVIGESYKKPAFSDRQIAAQQITRYIYLEKKALEIRFQNLMLLEKT